MVDYRNVVGFNYQPSYAWNSYEAWRFFDEKTVRKELENGKRLFPKMNTVRLWLSYDAFRYEEERQAENFDIALKICEGLGLKAVVCLFNCWHDAVMDNGGIYHPQMIDGSIWSAARGRFDSYIEKIVGRHRDDPRVLIWDIVNEPYSFGGNAEYRAFVEPYETEWMRRICELCKKKGARQPLGISHYADRSENPGVERIEKTADFTDVFLIHPYYFYGDGDLERLTDEGFDRTLENAKRVAEKYRKPLLTTETCWGSRDSAKRAEIVRRTLAAHKRAGIGYLAHALNYSQVADLHDEEDGPLGGAGNLMFITKEGTLREGHEVFNLF